MAGSNRLSWWQRGVIYQIYPRSFLDSNGDGIGDLDGIIQRLDYLNDGTHHSLGVDAIWIGPIFLSPMADFGYDVADYYRIDPAFGDLETLDRLIAEAHRRNIRVLMDYVPNHTSSQHPWFLESKSSRTSPKRDWYIWRDPAPDGSPPNNWGSEFGGPAWTLDGTTGQYYFHQYLPDQPDLNWRNPAVQAAMHDVLRFWLDRGVDGFRMDVVGMIFKHPDMPDQPLAPDAPPDLRPNDFYGRQLHLYDQDQPEAYQMAVEFRRLVESYGDTCILAEINFLGLNRWVRYYGSDQAGFHLPLFHQMLGLPWRAEEYRATVDAVEAAIPAHGWPNYVLGNHDIGRLASRIGDAQARVAAMLLLTLRGTPILYYGDELGLPNTEIPDDQILDPWGTIIGPERNRDVSRAPMPWDSTRNAGFSLAAPWLPISRSTARRNVAALEAHPTSILNLYHRLIWLRKEQPALQGGAYRALEGCEGCFIYERSDSQATFLVALNFTDTPRTVRVKQKNVRVMLSTHLDDATILESEALQLRANEGVLLKVQGEND